MVPQVEGFVGEVDVVGGDLVAEDAARFAVIALRDGEQASEIPEAIEQYQRQVMLGKPPGVLRVFAGLAEEGEVVFVEAGLFAGVGRLGGDRLALFRTVFGGEGLQETQGRFALLGVECAELNARTLAAGVDLRVALGVVVREQRRFALLGSKRLEQVLRLRLQRRFRVSAARCRRDEQQCEQRRASAAAN